MISQEFVGDVVKLRRGETIEFTSIHRCDNESIQESLAIAQEAATTMWPTVERKRVLLQEELPNKHILPDVHGLDSQVGLYLVKPSSRDVYIESPDHQQWHYPTQEEAIEAFWGFMAVCDSYAQEDWDGESNDS
jgi:hypothetical protein